MVTICIMFRSQLLTALVKSLAALIDCNICYIYHHYWYCSENSIPIQFNSMPHQAKYDQSNSNVHLRIRLRQFTHSFSKQISETHDTTICIWWRNTSQYAYYILTFWPKIEMPSKFSTKYLERNSNMDQTKFLMIHFMN